MPSTIPLPPWLQQGADPASSVATGYQIGMRAGMQQAQQAFQQQQSARQAQQDAQSQARWQAEFGLQQQQSAIAAKSAAQKFQAMQEYQKRVAAGQDPMTVLRDIGPLMNIPGSEMAAVIRQQEAGKWQPSPADIPSLIQTGPHSWQKRAPVKPAIQFQDVTDEVGNIVGQRNVTTGQYHPISPTSRGGMSEAQMLARADRLQKRLDGLLQNGLTTPGVRLNQDALDVDKADPKWTPAQVKYWQQTKALKDQIEGLESGEAPSGTGTAQPQAPGATPAPAAAASPFEVNFTRTAQGMVPERAMGQASIPQGLSGSAPTPQSALAAPGVPASPAAIPMPPSLAQSARQPQIEKVGLLKDTLGKFSNKDFVGKLSNEALMQAALGLKAVQAPTRIGQLYRSIPGADSQLEQEFSDPRDMDDQQRSQLQKLVLDAATDYRLVPGGQQP